MPVIVVPPAFKAGAIGQVFRVSINATTPFGAHVNTFHVRQRVASPSGDIFADIRDTWVGAVQDQYLEMFGPTFQLHSMRIGQVDDDIKGLPSNTYTLTGPGQRTVTGEALPPMDSALMDLVTGFSGRRGKGRQFLGLLYETDQAGGVVGTAQRTLITNYGNSLLAAFGPSAGVGTLVIFTKITNTVTDVTGITAKTSVYTQRRRRAGVGS